MTIAVVSGSFDPITKGHLYVIRQALEMADKVIVLVANNPDKKYFFPKWNRLQIVEESTSIWGDRVEVRELPHGRFTANVAKELGATMIVRGLRNVVDFEYEHSQQLMNNVIEPLVTTVFVMPPTDLIAVSSSAIKGIVGVDGWESIAERYIPTAALDALKYANSNRVA